jgi:hypothetical protein
VYFYYDFKWHHVNYVYKNVLICSDDIDPVPAAVTVSEPQGSSSSDEFISEPHFLIRKRSMNCELEFFQLFFTLRPKGS